MFSRGWLLLAAGLVTFAVADGIYYAQVADGTYAEWGLLDNGWPVATLLIAPRRLAAGAARAPRRRLGWRQLVGAGRCSPPSASASPRTPTPRSANPVAMGLACAAGIAVIVRMVATFRQNLVILAEARREAVTDALTGLGNRRRLLADLEWRLGGGRLVLVLADLNGFKRYNDTFGHAAGDALLSRLGARAGGGDRRARPRVPDGRRRVLRAARRRAGPGQALELVAGALTEHGEGFAVDASCGTVELPLEAADAVEALRLADTRMYERKRARAPERRGAGRRAAAAAAVRARPRARRPRQRRRRAGGRRRRAPRAAGRRARRHPQRRRAARHRQARDPGLDPRQAGAAGRGRVGVHAPPHADRRADPRRDAGPGRRRGAGAREPRAARRRGLPGPSGRRRDPARRAHRRRLRRLPRDGLGPSLPARAAARASRSRSCAPAPGRQFDGAVVEAFAAVLAARPVAVA